MQTGCEAPSFWPCRPRRPFSPLAARAVPLPPLCGPPFCHRAAARSFCGAFSACGPAPSRPPAAVAAPARSLVPPSGGGAAAGRSRPIAFVRPNVPPGPTGFSALAPGAAQPLFTPRAAVFAGSFPAISAAAPVPPFPRLPVSPAADRERGSGLWGRERGAGPSPARAPAAGLSARRAPFSARPAPRCPLPHAGGRDRGEGGQRKRPLFPFGKKRSYKTTKIS